MRIDENAPVKRNENIIWQKINDAVVVLVPEQLTLHAMTGCGGRIWELMEHETDIQEIVEQICEEYDVEPTKAGDEISRFIQKLEDMKLINFLQ